MQQRDLDQEKRERELWEDVRVVVAIARWPEHERQWFWRLQKDFPDEARIIAELVYLLDASPELDEPPPRRWVRAPRERHAPSYAKDLLERMRQETAAREEAQDAVHEHGDLRDLL